jgi:hypothetical protein
MPQAPVPARKTRRLALAIVLIFQTAFFAVFLVRPVQVVSDNVRYEEAGARLARGQGLSLPWELAQDDVVRDWVCGRHPDACTAADGGYPVAMYPPGYSVFIAGVYRLFGRSLRALVIAQLALLWLLFVLFEQMAARALGPVGYAFAMGVCATYPFIARQAGWIMSDHLHVVLLFGGLAALLLLRPGRLRGALFGLLMAAAALVRPYCLFVFPAVLLLPAVRRSLQLRWGEGVLAVAAFLLPFVVWTARNAYWYGRLVPLSTDNLGPALIQTTLEWEQRPAGTTRQQFIYGTVGRLLHEGNIEGTFGMQETYRGSRLLEEEAIRRIRQHPGEMVESVLTHIPKAWVSLRQNDEELSRAWPLLVLYLGGLWALGLAGMWLKRADGWWWAIAVTIGIYWAALLPIPADARRTLPLRLPMLLLAAAATEHAWNWLRSRRSEAIERVKPA